MLHATDRNDLSTDVFWSAWTGHLDDCGAEEPGFTVYTVYVDDNGSDLDIDWVGFSDTVYLSVNVGLGQEMIAFSSAIIQ